MIKGSTVESERHHRAIGRTLAVNTGAMIAGQAVNAVFVLMTARLLDAPGYAGLSVGLTVCAFVTTMFVFGMDRLGIVALGEASPDERGRLTRAMLSLAMIAAVCGGLVTALVLTSLPGVPAVARTTPVIAGFVLLTASEIVRSASCELPRVWHRHRQALLLGNGARMALTGALLAPIAVLSGLDLVTTVVALVIASLVLTVASVRATARLSSIGRALPDRVVRADVVRYLRGGIKLSVANIAWLALGQADVLVVAAFFDVRTVAAYALATRLVNFLNGGLVAANLSVLPLIAGRRATHGAAPGAEDRLMRGASSLVGWPMLGLAAVLAVSAPWSIPLVFGDGYADAPTFIRLLVLGQLVNVATGLAGSVLLREGRTSLILAFNVGVCVVVLPAEVLVASLGSVEAVAVLSAAGTAALNLLMYVTVRRRFGMNTAPYARPDRAIQLLRSST